MTIFKKLPDDVLNYLNEFLDIKSKVNLFYSNNNQELNKVCYIKRMTKSCHHLSDRILEQNIFDKLIEINVFCNLKIKNLNRFYQTLRIIDIRGFVCGVDDNGIKDCLKLVKIFAFGNSKIKKN